MSETVSADAPACCAYLRSKNMYVSGVYEPGDVHGQGTSEMSEVFWCNQTMRPTGPDGDFAEPESCCAGRGCFRDRLGDSA